MHEISQIETLKLSNIPGNIYSTQDSDLHNAIIVLPVVANSSETSEDPLFTFAPAK